MPEYATSALWKKAELLEVQKKHAEAILVYRRIPDQPANLWRIASCYERMRKVDQAVKQLKEIEAFFKQFGDRLPPAMSDELVALRKRLAMDNPL